MKKFSGSIATVTAASLLFATGAFAQQTTRPAPTQAQQESDRMMHSSHHRSSQILDRNVENLQGESLGEIEDLVFDARGEIIYAVLSFGGFLGFGDKYFAVPWSALSPKAGNLDVYVLNIDKDKLKDAPGFDKNNWPDTADSSWGSKIYSYYGKSQAWQEREARNRAQMATDSTSSSVLTTPSMTARDYTIHATIVKKMEPQQAQSSAAKQSGQTAAHVEERNGRLQLRTENGQMVELNVSPQLMRSLDEGDSMEVVLRKTAETAGKAQEKSPQTPLSK